MTGRGYPKVLHLIANLEIGGTERQLVEFVNRSTEPGRHDVACFYSIGGLARDFPTRPIWLGRIGRRPEDLPGDVGVLRALRRTIAGGDYDLVHAHLGLSEVMASLVTPRRTPIVASRRGRNRGFESHPFLKLVEGVGHRRVRVLICNSRYLEALTRRDRWPPPTRVIPNAVDLDRFHARAMADGVPRAAVVANLHPYKGHERILLAWRIIRQTLPDAEVTFVGDGVERGRLERLTDDLGLREAVTFAGLVDDPRPFVADAHAVALASDDEGFPNALLEAMAMARPVVATRVGGIPELVRAGQDGFLTSSDPSDMAERLLQLLGDADLRARMAASARSRAEAFTWDRVVQETEAVYRDVLGR